VLRKTQIPDMVQPYSVLEDVDQPVQDVSAKQAPLASIKLWRCPALYAPPVCEFCRKQVVSAASYHTTGRVESTREYNYWAGESTNSGGPVIIFGCQQCIAKHAGSTFEQGYSPWIRSYRVLRTWESWEKKMSKRYAHNRPWLQTDTRFDWKEYIEKPPDTLTKPVVQEIAWDARAILQEMRKEAKYRTHDTYDSASSASTRGKPALVITSFISGLLSRSARHYFRERPITLGEQGPDDSPRWRRLGAIRADVLPDQAGGKGRGADQNVRANASDQTGGKGQGQGRIVRADVLPSKAGGKGRGKGRTKGRTKDQGNGSDGGQQWENLGAMRASLGQAGKGRGNNQTKGRGSNAFVPPEQKRLDKGSR
jgi:hypothetical protein